MAALITRQQLIDAAADADTIEAVINGAADVSNPPNQDGTVTTRLGLVVKTVARVLADIIASPPQAWMDAFATDTDLKGPAGDDAGNSTVYVKTANYVATLANYGSIIRVDTTSAGAGGVIITVNRNLGNAAGAGVYQVHKIDIERSPADATSNPIIIQDDTGAEVGRIISPVAAHVVPFLTTYADGTTVVCRGTP